MSTAGYGRKGTRRILQLEKRLAFARAEVGACFFRFNMQSLPRHKRQAPIFMGEVNNKLIGLKRAKLQTALSYYRDQGIPLR